MAPKKQSDRQARENRERLRAYQARQSVHERGVRRRRRDNVLAGAGLAVILALAIITQIVYFGSGPGKAAASPSPSASAEAAACPPKPDPANTGDVPKPTKADCRTWTGSMTLNDVKLGFQLYGKKAPQAVTSTVDLIQKGFYKGLSCHRLTDGDQFSVLQCGDPNGDGTGGPGYSYGPVENAPADGIYPAGTIAMARQSGNAASNGSQFFIVYGKTKLPTDSAGGYSVIGKITSGLDQLKTSITDAGVAGGGSDGKPAVPTTITAITVH